MNNKNQLQLNSKWDRRTYKREENEKKNKIMQKEEFKFFFLQQTFVSLIKLIFCKFHPFEPLF